MFRLYSNAQYVLIQIEEDKYAYNEGENVRHREYTILRKRNERYEYFKTKLIMVDNIHSYSKRHLTHFDVRVYIINRFNHLFPL